MARWAISLGTTRPAHPCRASPAHYSNRASPTQHYNIMGRPTCQTGRHGPLDTSKYAQEVSTSHGPSIRPPVSSTSACMQLIRGRGRGRGRGKWGVDHRGRARDGGPGHGPDSDNGLVTLEPTLPTSIPSHTYPSLDMLIPPQIDTSPFIPPHIDTSPSIPSYIDTSPSIPPYSYTSPSILPHTDTSVPYLVSPEPTSIAVDITLS